MSKINEILLWPFLGRIDYKSHYLGCFFLFIIFSLVNVVLSFILVVSFIFLKEYFLDKKFCWIDVIYGLLGVLTGFIVLLIYGVLS